MPANYKHARYSGVLVAFRSLCSCMERGTGFLPLVSKGHAISRRGSEMRASILDQPPIAVAECHVEKVDRYDGNDGPIGTVDIVHGKERVDDRDIGLDEANSIIGERRLRGPVDCLRLRTELLHHCDPPLQIVTLRRHKGSIFGE